MNNKKTRFEGADPILSVRDMAAAVRYYVDTLGFEKANWGDENFTSVNRDRAGIYLCAGEYQGAPGARVWIGVKDAEMLCEEL
jgi:catechol 2,3-dioxygenase-like lactoylglutathione lyase family enzyme